MFIRNTPTAEGTRLADTYRVEVESPGSQHSRQGLLYCIDWTCSYTISKPWQSALVLGSRLPHCREIPILNTVGLGGFRGSHLKAHEKPGIYAKHEGYVLRDRKLDAGRRTAASTWRRPRIRTLHTAEVRSFRCREIPSRGYATCHGWKTTSILPL